MSGRSALRLHSSWVWNFLRPVYSDTTQLNSTRQREQQLTQFVGRDVINKNTTDAVQLGQLTLVDLSCVAINTPLTFMCILLTVVAATAQWWLYQNAFVTIYLISSFTKLIDMAVQVADIAGTTHRSVYMQLRSGLGSVSVLLQCWLLVVFKLQICSIGTLRSL